MLKIKINNHSWNLLGIIMLTKDNNLHPCGIHHTLVTLIKLHLTYGYKLFL